MLLWPPASQTSPIITSANSSRFVSCETRSVYGPLAGSAGRIASHGASVSCSPYACATAIVCATVTPWSSIRSTTTRPSAGAAPNTATGVSRCSTIWSLNTAATRSEPLRVRSAAPLVHSPPSATRSPRCDSRHCDHAVAPPLIHPIIPTLTRASPFPQLRAERLEVRAQFARHLPVLGDARVPGRASART